VAKRHRTCVFVYAYICIYVCLYTYTHIYIHVYHMNIDIHILYMRIFELFVYIEIHVYEKHWICSCCSVLQCFAVCCSVLQCFAVCCSVLQCVAVLCSVLQCAAVCCSVLQCAAVCLHAYERHWICSGIRIYRYICMSTHILYTCVSIYIDVVSSSEAFPQKSPRISRSNSKKRDKNSGNQFFESF